MINRDSRFVGTLHVLVLFITIVLLSGCGSSEVGFVDPDATPIGPEGGTVKSSDGKASAVFPPGALAWKTAVAITRASEVPAGHIWAPYEFSPGNINFLKPVTISIAYEEDTLPTGLNESELRLAKITNNTLDHVMDCKVNEHDNVVSSEVGHFSSYNLVNTGNTPTGVKAYSVNTRLINSALARGITIKWKPVLDAASYNIYWSTTPGVSKETGSIIPGVTSPYTHEDLTYGNTFYYIVTAVNGNDEKESLETAALPGSDYISGGSEHVAVIKDDSTVWTWGQNTWGQLGVSTTETCVVGDKEYPCSTTPVQVSGLTDVISVAAGRTFTMALKTDGTVWTWGLNNSGELGDGTNVQRVLPGKVVGLTDVAAIAAGWTTGAALKSDGTVWTWGENTYGAIGDGTIEHRNTPVQVNNLTDIIAISAKRSHIVALRNDGTIWAWGHNRRGQLGDGTHEGESKRPVTLPVQVSDFDDPDAAISAGYWHSIAMKGDGTVLTWGRNESGELCDGTDISITAKPLDATSPAKTVGLGDVFSVKGGEGYTMSLRKDGTVWMCGDNSSGLLGIGDPKEKITAPRQVPGLPDVIAIESARYYAVVLRRDGTIWTWGFNNLGQLGDGTTTHRGVPVQVLMNPLF